MRVAVIGGGPAGLYFAILMKRDRPEARVTVVERNRADDTFGFGVVCSDQTLETFERADRESYEAITEAFDGSVRIAAVAVAWSPERVTSSTHTPSRVAPTVTTASRAARTGHWARARRPSSVITRVAVRR